MESRDAHTTSLRDYVDLNTSDDDEFASSRYFKEVTKLLTMPKIDVTKWQKWIESTPQVDEAHPYVKAHVEATVSTVDGKVGTMVGWVISRPDSILWIEDSKGHPIFFDEAYRSFRQDVYDAFVADMVKAEPNSGFLLALNNVKPGEILHIKALSSRGVHIISSVKVSMFESDPKRMAEWLFTVECSMSDLSHRFDKVDLKLIGTAIEERNNAIEHMPVTVTHFGEVNGADVSIIVPLYGRIDFIEGQMVAFVTDSFIVNQCELIYVIDDPQLVEPLKILAENLYQLYRIPFKLVFGGANRGFSGANNLGAEHSVGDYLLFMNSDVFPQSPGWIEKMKNALQENLDLGVIAPRLVFADGSIQHAGIEFKFRMDLGVWINHHPNMGLDPKLDPNKVLTRLPAVTGACMLISKENFEAVGGWDTGYLIGDFEDSDFCLKLRNMGKECGYLPTVELTHLERQSFSLTGAPDFRTKLVILNATRHQKRWLHLINKVEN